SRSETLLTVIRFGGKNEISDDSKIAVLALLLSPLRQFRRTVEIPELTPVLFGGLQRDCRARIRRLQVTAHEARCPSLDAVNDVSLATVEQLVDLLCCPAARSRRCDRVMCHRHAVVAQPLAS